MRLIFPIDKPFFYGVNHGPLGTPQIDLPPYLGPIYHPAVPDEEGHFDSVPIDTPEFAQAHVFGTIRFVLDLWERYLGQRVVWHFASDYRQLEIVIQPPLHNAHAGYGFMEVGSYPRKDGTIVPYALNFDVMAHELGHLIIYSLIGLPSPAAAEAEYYGFHESAADMSALIAAMHFESLLSYLLEESRGNLYTYNELNRFAELGEHEQIRLASNETKLSEFSDGWDDEHALSQPLTGALFDIIVDVFQEILVARSFVSPEIAAMTRQVRDKPDVEAVIQAHFDKAYAAEPQAFRAALISARDCIGSLLANTWKRLSADNFTYLTVARIVAAEDLALSGGRFQQAIAESFEWREIGRAIVGPRLKPPGPNSHTHSARTLTPAWVRHLPKMSYRERAIAAGLTGSLFIAEGGS